MLCSTLSCVAAPEVISNKKHYDGVMADVWSSGVMLYVMLFGQYPFERPEDKKEANRYLKRRFLMEMIARCAAVSCPTLRISPAAPALLFVPVASCMQPA